MTTATYKTTADHARELRQLLKKRYGWTGRQVSIRTDNYSLGSSIRVEIKDGSIPLPLVTELAEDHESIRRCEITGDILSGGNRYVSVNLSEAARDVKARRYLDAVQEACDQVDEWREDDPRRTKLAPVAGIEDCHIGAGRWPGNYTVWLGSHTLHHDQPSPWHAALDLACGIEKRDHEKGGS